MNLVMNAAEAIDRPLGTVAVSTGVGTFAAEELARSLAGGDAPGGTYVYVDVRDDGVGMTPATIAQMFDPFFTTKFTGRGLGMAAVLGIVRAHAGAIDVRSTPGEGTRIRVFFPVSATKHATRSAPPPDTAASPRGVVLLVEDEKNVRISTQLLLEDFGFEVVPALDGIEALEAFAAHPTRIAVVLLDLTMPRMDGVETLRELRRMAPDLPVVLTTGHGTTYLEDAQVGDAPEAVLAKPYSAAQLVDALEQAMRGRR
jgi:CheY-like chemotaxis protein